MTTNKNQHFVPRCHLRPFTLEGRGSAINVFNLDRKKLIPNAPVKSQCSKDYFYGKDEQLESAIQLIESGYGQALREIIGNSSSFTEANKTVLRTFWVFQHLRTEAAALRAVELAESARELSGLPPEDYTLKIRDAVQIACRTFVDSMHEIDDLKFCLIKNKTKIPFITSDNPAILTNKWRLERNRDPVHSFGMGSAGMLAIMPLTPKLLFLGYDGDVYSTPHKKGIVTAKNVRDVIALNRHQLLQCTANVYVHDKVHEEMLIRHYSDIELIRPKERHIVHYAELDRTEGDYSRYVIVPQEKLSRTNEAIMHAQVIHPHPGIWPSQIQIRNNGSVYTNGTGVGYSRLSRTYEPSTRVFWRERP